jgi:dTDP-4-amino-4,6-dideoxygalactose transaminase
MATDTLTSVVEQELAINGGPKAVEQIDEQLFHWPIVTDEDEQAVLEVLRAGSMSNSDITEKFEKEFAAWLGTEYALGYPNGTMALLAAFYAVGVRRGDEVICPSMTYWASAMPVMQLGGTLVFADVDRDTLCIDPGDIERHITDRTKAIVPVHYAGHPCEMDAICEIARKHNLKIVEDVSHAQGGLYKGRKVGTFGDVAAMSMMAGKSFAIGEGGMLATSDRKVLETAVSFANYARHGTVLTDETLKSHAGIPLGGCKGRMNQTAAAMGRVQLKYYDARIGEIQAAMNRFWDLLEDCPGVRAHRTAKDSGSTMAGWYASRGLYVAEELGGLDVAKFCEAVCAEGVSCGAGSNAPLHLHPMFNDVDIFGDGKPTRIAFSDRDLRQPEGSLPNAEASVVNSFSVPWFKHDKADQIERYAAAFRKVATQADKLL